MSKLLFITIAGNSVGLGHLNRCLALAQQATHKNLSSHFLLFADNEAELRIKQEGYDYCFYDFLAWTSHCIKDCLDKVSPIKAVIIDFSHPAILQQEEKIHASLRYLHDYAQEIVIIDSIGEQALTTRMPNLPISIVVMPYAGVFPQKNNPWRFLAGPAYAILSSAYAGLKRRMINKKGNRILISCGGSDPKQLTLLALKGLESYSEILNVRVIIGPLFDENLKIILKNIATNSKHRINLMDAPKTLVSDMLWCDLAISTSGLTKYELAATSTPAILISIDEFHHRVNHAFSAIGSTVDLGVEVTSELIAEQVNQLLTNFHARRSMANAGRQTVDGNGAERLIKEIINVTK